jgi:hypothetical protein
MPTYDEIYQEDQGKRRHYQRLMDGAKGVKGDGIATWLMIVGALAFLWLVRRGFRGVSAGGLMVGAS